MSYWVTNVESIASIILTPLAILGIGWWVNTTIRKKNQSDSIVVDHLQQLQKEIHRLTVEAIDAPDVNTCTSKLRVLSNEIHHLTELHALLVGNNVKIRQKFFTDLNNILIELKILLTDDIKLTKGNRVNRVLARQYSNQLREKTLENILYICAVQNFKKIKR